MDAWFYSVYAYVSYSQPPYNDWQQWLCFFSTVSLPSCELLSHPYPGQLKLLKETEAVRQLWETICTAHPQGVEDLVVLRASGYPSDV